LRTRGFIQGNPRVSYPFSNYNMSDAHVYSSYLSFTFIAYQEYIKKMLYHANIHSYIVSILSVGALLLTGSKTGLLVISIYFIIIIMRFINSFSKKILVIIITTTITLSISILILFNTQTDCDIDIDCFNYSNLYNRAITYNVEGDSINGRLRKAITALNEISQNYLLIGNGPTGASMKWYDGGVSILLAHGGVLSLISLIIYINMILARSKRRSIIGKSYGLHKVFTLLLFIYLLLSVITEHFLITRNLLPVATLLSVIYANIKLNYIESSMNVNHLDPIK
jgi:low affinity Fe/Cu permease